MPVPSSNSKTQNAIEQAEGLKPEAFDNYRNVDSESIKPKLNKQIGIDYSESRYNEKDIIKVVEPSSEVTISDMCKAFADTALSSEISPDISTYLPSSRMMYFIVHIMDELMCSNHQFLQSQIRYHPLISRLYFGVLFYVRTLKCMQLMKLTSQSDNEFIREFELAFPFESLPIPGPLVVIFQSLCISTADTSLLSNVCPYIPTTTIPLLTRDDKCKPIPVAKNWWIPNIPGIIMLINRIQSQAYRVHVGRPTFPDTIDPYVAAPTAQGYAADTLNIGGYSWPTDMRNNPDVNWYRTTPGIEYAFECPKETNERFIRTGIQLGIPIITRTSRFNNARNFCCMSNFDWFSKIIPIMGFYCNHFKSKATLKDCSLIGPAASQVIIDYDFRLEDVIAPIEHGDPTSIAPLAFTAKTNNPNTNRQDHVFAFTSQINVNYPSGYQLLAQIVPDQPPGDFSPISGPFWTYRTNCLVSTRNRGYLRLPETIASRYYQQKPDV